MFLQGGPLPVINSIYWGYIPSDPFIRPFIGVVTPFPTSWGPTCIFSEYHPPMRLQACSRSYGCRSFQLHVGETQAKEFLYYTDEPTKGSNFGSKLERNPRLFQGNLGEILYFGQLYEWGSSLLVVAKAETCLQPPNNILETAGHQKPLMDARKFLFQSIIFRVQPFSEC